MEIIGKLKKLGYKCKQVSYEDFLEKREYTRYKGFRYVIDNTENVIGLKFNYSIHMEPQKIPKQIWELKNLKWLFLNGNNLKDIPTLVTNFQKLEVLDLSSNELKKLPEFLTQLKNLLDLNISSNFDLLNLPEFIGSFPNLQKLNISSLKIKQLPDTISKLTNLTELDISSNELESFPESVYALKNLQKLNISGIQLSELPKSIGKLKKLIELNLSSNGLKDIPDFISSLTNLRKLNLSFNSLERISESIAKLSKLTDLDLSMTGLNEIPESICHLPGLIKLDISSNEITSIPNYIGKLKKLSVLNLEGNNVRSISNAIGNLTDLTELDISNNQVSSLPNSMRKLKNLKKLILSSNSIQDISSLSDLGNLEELSLWENQIKEIPEGITSLKSLQDLNLSENRIEKIPDSIGNLQNLSYLNLSENQLTSIPTTIGELTNLINLSLSKNNILFLPESILKLENLESIGLNDNQLPLDRSELNANAQELLEYYFEKIKQKESVYDYRVLILGESQAGKTRLIERLIHKEFHEGQRTDGLETRTWTISLPEDKKTTVRLNLWDFGGQEIYHSTHKFFLSENSLYMFLWDTNQGRKEYTFEYWLNIIESYGGDSPILFVITKSDEKPMELNYHELQERYPQIQGFYKISSRTGQGIEELELAIRTLVSKNRPHWETRKWEHNWLQIKNELISNPNYKISYENDYFPMCKKYNLSVEEAKSLIEFLRYTGHVLHFPDSKISNLKNSIILKREQIIAPIYKVLEIEEIKNRRGIVYKKDFYRIIQGDKTQTEFLSDLIIDIMCEFDLCFQLQKDKYLIPSLLSEEPIHLLWNYADNLQIEYHYNFFPPGLMERFLAQLKDFIIQLNKESYACWESGAYVQKKESYGFVHCNRYDRKIILKVLGEDVKEKQEFLTILRNDLDKVCKRYNKLKIEMKVPCNCSTNCDYRFPYQFLRGLEREKETHTHCQLS
ncbi:MAG: leucine-rich repeat domain-containing protein, partial [Leptospiraceae bacterium]|nr:leucine-rich repeat domain-containing protein [Leptospiraceae bacterium]